MPRQLGVDEFIAERTADVLLITPLIELGSPQLDYMRAARAHGIRSALCVWSWDHLSSKALIRVVPDTVIVWNEMQRDEAERFHGIPRRPRASSPARSASTNGSIGRRRATVTTFCRRVGSAARRPFVLYVCSALFKGSPSEAAFVRAVDRGDPAARAMPRLRDMADPRAAAPAAARRNGSGGARGARRAPDAVLWGSNPDR